MKSKTKKLKYQIFLYMALGLAIWFLISTSLSEFLYYLEDKRGVEFPFRFYIVLNVVQVCLLVLVNIPFLSFLIKHVDKPVQEIIVSLNEIGDENYDVKIDFESQNEFDKIKDAFNKMAEKLSEAEKIKRNAENDRILLFANMAHDLKTPITSIIGFSKALNDGIICDEEKKSEYIKTINTKAVRINALIDRVFEYVKLESSDNILKIEECDVAEILRNCVADFYTEFETKKISLEIEIPEKKIIKAVDPVEISRVFTNLLNNILKHNSEGIKALVKMDENGRVLIADSGEKISDELSQNLFKPFVSGDFSRNSKNGSGLGLSLSYKIMKKHGGNLSLKREIEGYTKAFVAEL
ncbi:MAG: HAMP domain-containing histidine kinase [Treponema sp.]|nr:HAMP domain-containing histidine kinase [Treponema sp.]